MIILGINDGRHHNTGASVLIDGRLVASVEQERISRIKMDNAYPHEAIDEVLALAGVQPDDVDVVALANLSRWDQRPYLNRLFRHVAELGRQEPLIRRFYWKHQYDRFTRVLRPRKKPHGVLSRKPRETVEHHLAHAASAYYASPFRGEKVAVVTLDGSGDFSWGSVWVGHQGRLEHVRHMDAVNSLGLLYSAVTVYLGFKATRHEGKVLGLAAYGRPEPLLSRLLRHVNQDDWDHLLDARLARVTLRQFADMGQSVIREMCADLSREDVAAGIQALTEKLICQWIRRQMRELGVGKLAVAGGVFANVKLNQRLLALPEVDNIYIHPNMGDGGLATGAAYEVHARHHGRLHPRLLEQVYLGTAIDRAAAMQALRDAELSYEEPEDMATRVATMLADGKVVARASGGMEYGPRALGNRTVMAACNDPSINQWLNKKFQRTEFMPFAPVILEEAAADYFPAWKPEHVAARFMTITYDASEKARKNIPAAVHVDGTARPQVIRRQDNPDYYDIIAAYRDLTGVPSVINTSFNMHEEPIVRTADEAIRAFLSAGLDALILGPFLVTR